MATLLEQAVGTWRSEKKRKCQGSGKKVREQRRAETPHKVKAGKQGGGAGEDDR